MQMRAVDAVILVVEDDPDLRDIIELNLLREGFKVRVAKNLADAESVIKKSPIDVLVLDRMLPDGEGLSLAKRLQGRVNKPYILILSALSEEDDIVQGLLEGADDYLKKPFSTKELIARVRVGLRYKSKKSSPHLKKGPIVINLDSHSVMLDEDDVILTRFEYLLLLSLVKQSGKVLSREKLIDSVQGEQVVVTPRTIDTHIFALRRKLKEHASLIETVRGVGYRFNEP